MTVGAGETTFNAGINLGGNIVFEGSTANSFETTLVTGQLRIEQSHFLPDETFKLSSGGNKATLDGNGSATTITVGAGYDVVQFLVTINRVVQNY